MGAIDLYFDIARAESEQVEEACRFISPASIPSLQRLAEKVRGSEDLVRRWAKVYPDQAAHVRPILDLMENTRQTLERALWQLLTQMPAASRPKSGTLFDKAHRPPFGTSSTASRLKNEPARSGEAAGRQPGGLGVVANFKGY